MKNKENTIPVLKWKDVRNLINETEETLMRLHVFLRGMERDKRFQRLNRKINKKGVSILTKRDKEEFEVFFSQVKYYQAKMLAYIFVLERLKQFELINVIKRVRGMVFDKGGATVKETKFYH